MAYSVTPPGRFPVASFAGKGSGLSKLAIGVRDISRTRYYKPDFSGDGYLAGEFPGGTTTVNGAPTAAEVRVVWRDPAGGAMDGYVVKRVTSAPGGTWRVTGLDTDQRFDIVGRLSGYNDVIQSSVAPTPMLVISRTGDFALSSDYRSLAGTVLVSGGLPPYAVSVSSGAAPTGWVIAASGHSIYSSGTSFQTGDFAFTIKVQASNGPFVEIPVSVIGVIGASEPYFGYVSSLLHFDGVDGSTAYSDSTGKTWANIGTGKLSSIRKKFGATSFQGDGTTSGLVGPASADFDFDSGDFAIQGWIYIAGNSPADNDGARSATIFNTWDAGSGATDLKGYTFTVMGSTTNTGTGLAFDTWGGGGAGTLYRATTTISQNAWHHVSISVEAGVRRLFLDGVLLAGVTTNLSGGYTKANSFGSRPRIGTTLRASYPLTLNGNIDDLRVTKDWPRETKAFTPPAIAYEDSAGVSDPLWRSVASLLHFDGEVGTQVHRDMKLKTWTRTGSVTIEADAGAFGGASARFGGGRLDCNTGWSPGTGDFTIEFFFKTFQTGGNTYFDNRVSTPATDTVIYQTNGSNQMIFYAAGASRIVSANLANDTRYHFALSRVAGVTRMFIDGVPVATTYTDANNYNAPIIRIGQSLVGGSALNGWLDEYRITNAGRYPAAFTRPSGPFPQYGGPKIATFKNEVLADTPYVYYRLDEAAGTVAYDQTASYRIGVIAGAGTDLERGAAAISGDDDAAFKYLTNSGYVRSVGAVAFPASGFTLMTIIRPNAGAAAGYIAGLSANSNPTAVNTARDRCLLIDTEGKLRAYLYTGAQAYLVSADPINDGNARIIHLVSGAGSTQLYINGVQVATLAAESSQNYSAYLFGGMGNLSDITAGTADGLRGIQDELAWFNTKLSPARILAHANACGLGGVTYPVQTLLSATNKASDIVLASNSAEAESNSSTSAGGLILSATGKTSGKFYAEFTNTQIYASGSALSAGLHRDIAGLTNYLGQDADGWAAWIEGSGGNTRKTYTNAVSTNTATLALSVGQVARIAVDFGAGKVWFGHFGVADWVGGGDPVAGTLPTYTFTPGASTYYLALNPRGGDAAGNRNKLGLVYPSAWKYPAPAGYGVWT